MKTNKKIPKRRNGYYYLDNGDPNGREYVSVTTVLQVIAKPALMYWAAKTAAKAALKDPSISEEEASKSIYGAKKKAGIRGSDVHKFVETYKKGGKVTIRKELKPYADAFVSFLGQTDPKIKENEKEIYSDKYKYAGTLDIIMEDKQGKVWIVDIKTTSGVYPESGLQLVAYKQACEEMGYKIDKTGVLLLKNDGTYSFHETNEKLDIFLATKKLWEWWKGEK